MDSRRWWLLAAAVPVALGCALATARACPAPWPGSCPSSAPGSWPPRCCGAAPAGPPVGAPGGCWPSLRCCRSRAPCSPSPTGARDPLTVAVLRWAPTVPGYVVSIVAVLALVERRRLRAGARMAVEVALFLVACLVVVEPAGRRPGRQLDGVRSGRAAGAGLGRPRHVGDDGRRPDAAGRHRGRPPAHGGGAAGRHRPPDPRPRRRHLRPAGGHAAGSRGRRPRADRRRPARCWPSRRCSTAGPARPGTTAASASSWERSCRNWP